MTKYYTEDHEWISLDGDQGTVGISDYAQNSLGDIVFIELPEVGNDYNKSDEIAVIESVKAASEIYTPVSGTITEVNSDLESDPAIVNNDAEVAGWIYKIKLSDTSDVENLMSEDAYKAFISDLD